MRVNDRLDAIALIQAVKGMYADSGIDIQPRIDRWLVAAQIQSCYDLTEESAKSLASAMHKAYLNERSELPILAIATRKTLHNLGLSALEWKQLMHELDDSDRDTLLGTWNLNGDQRSELLKFAGIEECLLC